MRPLLPYRTVEQAAVEVATWANHTGMPRLTARPYNRFDPTNTSWYLVPSTDWPAYRYAKLELEPQAGSRILRAGFYVEKGLGSALASMYKQRPGYIIDATWEWHHIMQAMGDGELEEAMQRAAERAGLPLRIWLDSGYPAADAEGAGGTILRDNWSYWTYTWLPGGVALTATDGAALRPDPLAGCTSMRDLPAALRALPDRNWRWVNLLIGVEVALATADDPDDDEVERWDAGELWRRALSPWRDWLALASGTGR